MQSFASYWKGANDFIATAAASDLAAKARAAARDVADAASKVSDTVQAEYRRTFVDLDCQIFTVRPELTVMEFPAEDKIDRLATRLNSTHAQRMMILNMSEKRYDTTKFDAEVVDVAFRGLPSPPVELLMELCLSAHHWLAADAGNILVVHCFQGYSRSAVFLSCFMAFRGLFAHPVDALHHVCQCVGISDKMAIVPSQRRYLTYFQQCQQGLAPCAARLRLLRAQLNGVPKFEAEGAVAFRPYVEVWNAGELVYSSLAPTCTAGEAVNLPAGVSATDSCVSFQFPGETYVTGDVLIRIRHASSDGARDTAVRLAFHTGFVPDGFQLAKHELDSACADPRFSDDSFLDLIFERAAPEGGPEAALPAPVFEKAREVSKRLAEEERKRQEAEAATAAAAGKAKPSERDEFAELEEALRRGPAASESSATSSSAQAMGDAAEPRESPAAAAGGDSSRVAASPPEPPRSAAATEPEEEAATNAPGQPPPKPGLNNVKEAAPAPAPSEDAGTRDARSDIDDLFSEFDAALASVAGDAGLAPAPAGAGAAAPAASCAKQPAAAAGKADDSKPTADDPFGDVDAFLAELDAT